MPLLPDDPFPPLSSLVDQIAFDRVDLVGLAPYELSATSDRHAVEWAVALDDAACQHLASLIAALPNSDSARCHDPRFGLRIGTADPLAVDLCFRCHNAFLRGRGHPADDHPRGASLYTFRGDSPAAQALLAFLRTFVPPVFTAGE